MVVFMFEHSSMFVWIWIMLAIAFGKGVYRFVRSKGDFSTRITAVKEEYFAKDFEGLSTSVIFIGLAFLFLFSYLLVEHGDVSKRYLIHVAESEAIQSSSLSVKPLEAEFTAPLDAVVYSRDEQNGDKVSEFTPLDEKRSIATVTFGDGEVANGSATSFMVNRADKFKVRTNQQYKINYADVSKGKLSIYPDSEQNLRSVRYRVTGFNKGYRYYLDGVTRIPDAEVERGDTMITLFATFSHKEKDDDEEGSLPPYRVVKEHNIIGYDKDWNIRDCYLIRQ